VDVPWKRSEKPIVLLAVALAAFAALAVDVVVEAVLSVDVLLPLPVVTVADEGLVGLSVHAEAQSPRPISKTV